MQNSSKKNIQKIPINGYNCKVDFMNLTYNQFLKKMKARLSFEPLDNFDELVNELKNIEMLDMNESSTYITDYRANKFIYISPNVKDISGYTREETLSYGPDGIMALFHPKDREIISDILFIEGDKAIKKTPNIFNYKLKISFTYRLQQKDGTYVKILNQFTPILINKSKEIVAIMGTTTLHNSSNDDIISNVKYKTPFGNWITIYNKIFPVNNEIENKLSPKELEIVQLVAAGFSAKEIATKTNKSIETINTQRKNIIAKTNTQSMTDVVVLALKNKWI